MLYFVFKICGPEVILVLVQISGKLVNNSANLLLVKNLCVIVFGLLRCFLPSICWPCKQSLWVAKELELLHS